RERLDMNAVRVDRPPRFQAKRAFDQVAGLDPMQVERIGTDDPLDSEQVAEAGGTDEADPWSAALDQQVGSDRSPVDETIDVARTQPRLLDRVEDAARGPRWRRERRGDVDTALAVERDDGGEGSAGVDGDALCQLE